jgi:hypothetical protein
MNLAEILSLIWGGGAVWFAFYQIRNDRFYYRSFWGISGGWLKRSQAPIRFRVFTTGQFLIGLFVLWASLSHNVGYKGTFLRGVFTKPLF